MTPLDLRRSTASTVPFVAMVVVVALLAVAQFRWLAELGNASSLRLERDLRVAVQTAVAELSLATSRLASELEGATDPRARAAAWAGWRRSVPDLAALYRQDSARLVVDPRFALDSLLPRLAGRVAALAEVEVGLALVRREPGGSESIVARYGMTGAGPADVEARLPLVGWRQRAVFHPAGSDSASGPTGQPPASFSWEVRSDSSAVGVAIDRDWSLQAWHEAGSLERAVGRVRRRNLLLGSALILVLAGSATLTLHALRRHERLAIDRATVLAGIAHEVRTPIAVIRSAADNLASGVVTEPDRIREYGALVEREVDRLESDVEAALAFTVAAAPTGAVADRLDLRDVVTEVREASEAPERVVIESAVPVECRVDRRAVTIAIRNLVANALAYSPADQPVLVRMAVRGEQAELAVLDRGPGIAPADRRRVFDPFVRGAAGSASGRPGLGLGLALARRIAGLHGGSLEAEDREGGGTILRLRFLLR